MSLSSGQILDNGPKDIGCCWSNGARASERDKLVTVSRFTDSTYPVAECSEIGSLYPLVITSIREFFISTICIVKTIYEPYTKKKEIRKIQILLRDIHGERYISASDWS